MIGIVDYGRGNLRSVEKALHKLGYTARIMAEPQEIEPMQGIILPGVGAFGDAMAALERHGWVEPLLTAARSGKPFLGICLGMQLLFSHGEEHGWHEGLGLLKGRVIHFPPGRKIPHMGWNNVSWVRESVLSRGIPDRSFFYFVHSYYAVPEDPEVVWGVADYGVQFPAFVGRDNVWGTQFHPEKSSPWGLTLLDNFARQVNVR
ncbi:MAG: imidazole glycerol phosphate synthase subunit HisH [Peptococcaceae bacterium]|jgi:glutamine amidotransferase|nr:imidazole glycerol phosphate synthase subunit HisH [Peptococcaceae bacterium]